MAKKTISREPETWFHVDYKHEITEVPCSKHTPCLVTIIQPNGMTRQVYRVGAQDAYYQTRQEAVDHAAKAIALVLVEAEHVKSEYNKRLDSLKKYRDNFGIKHIFYPVNQ